MSRSGTPLPLHHGPTASTSNPAGEPGSRPPSRQAHKGSPSQSITSAFAQLGIAEAALKLNSSLIQGLTPNESLRRLHTNGPNELPHEEPEPLWLRFLKQFKETLILLLLASAAVSLIMRNYEDAISITTAVTIVVTVGFVQEYRSEKSLEALNRLVPHYAHIIRGGGTHSRSRTDSDPSKNSAKNENFQLQPLNNGMSARSSLSDEISMTVSASQLVPGDLVLFNTGDRIPADIRITQATDLTIDESNLTGENEPVMKSSEVPQNFHPQAAYGSSLEPHPTFYASPATGTVGADIRLNEQTNIAFMGTLVRSGYGQGLVIGTGGNTEFGAISASLQEIESPRTPLQASMDKLGKQLSYMSFGVIGFIMLLGLLRGWELLVIFQIGVSLAVAAIPEGLPIIVTVTLALGVLRMSGRGAIVRRLPSVETLGSVNVICSDKTGTLTMNHMTVTKAWHSDQDAPFETSTLQTSSSLDSATRTIFRIGNIANNARLTNSALNTGGSVTIMSSTLGNESSSATSRWLGSPTDVAMLDLLDTLGEEDVRPRLGPRRSETPFSSERKWMGVIIRGHHNLDMAGVSDKAYIKGAIEQVLSKCDTYVTRDGREVVLDEKKRKKALEMADRMASEGLRVLAFASGALSSARSKSPVSGKLRSGNSTPVMPEPKTPTQLSAPKDEEVFQGLIFAGLVGMSDPPRQTVKKSIRRLMAGKVKVIMITGDAESTAIAICQKIGMPVNLNSAVGRSVIRGDELDKMTDEELQQAIATTNIFARTSPEHKMKIVRALQSRGDVVAMTGDGVNDAPALKKADIGVSMGKLGTDVAKEAADMILTDDDFSTILSAIEEGKGIFSNIQNFLTFQLSTSAAALSLVFISTCFGFKNPLNAMQILWINILMDGPPAQSLGVEPVDPSVMTRPPRSKNAAVLTRPLLQRVLQSATIIMLGTLFTYIYEMTDGEVTARDTTMTFTSFVLFDMFNALTCRSERKSVLRGEIGLFSNKMFNYAVSGSLIGQALVIYLPPLQRIFQTEPLGILDLVRLVAIASCVFWVDEGRKWMKMRSQSGLGGYSSRV